MPHRDKAHYNEYMREYMLHRYHVRRSSAIERLGGRCRKCGTTSDLNLHHIDPASKAIEISRMWSVSQERYDAEVAKCEVLCEQCHIEEHRSQHPCGTPQRYWTGCRCDACKSANSRHNKQYRLDKVIA